MAPVPGTKLPAPSKLPAPGKMPAHLQPDWQQKRYVPPHIQHDQYVASLYAKHDKSKTPEAKIEKQRSTAERYFPATAESDEAIARGKLPPTAREAVEAAAAAAHKEAAQVLSLRQKRASAFEPPRTQPSQQSSGESAQRTGFEASLAPRTDAPAKAFIRAHNGHAQVATQPSHFHPRVHVHASSRAAPTFDPPEEPSAPKAAHKAVQQQQGKLQQEATAKVQQLKAQQQVAAQQQLRAQGELKRGAVDTSHNVTSPTAPTSEPPASWLERAVLDWTAQPPPPPPPQSAFSVLPSPAPRPFASHAAVDRVEPWSRAGASAPALPWWVCCLPGGSSPLLPHSAPTSGVHKASGAHSQARHALHEVPSRLPSSHMPPQASQPALKAASTPSPNPSPKDVMTPLAAAEASAQAFTTTSSAAAVARSTHAADGKDARSYRPPPQHQPQQQPLQPKPPPPQSAPPHKLSAQHKLSASKPSPPLAPPSPPQAQQQHEARVGLEPSAPLSRFLQTFSAATRAASQTSTL